MLTATGQVLGFILGHPLGRRRPVRCVARFAGWQVRSRLKPGPHVVPFVGRTRLWAKNGETGVSGNIYVGLHEFAEMAFVLHILRPGDLFADVGANAGSYTVLASGVAGARTVAVEPVEETVARLERNITLNGLEALARVERCAVGDSEGTVRFATGQDTTNRIAVAGMSGPITEVPVRRLDSIFIHECPKVMKLDVEGHDREALAGARHLLQDQRLLALIVEVSERGDDATARSLQRQGFRACRYDAFERQLKATGEIAHGGNAIFVRDLATARSLLATAPKTPVMGLHV